MHIEYLVYVGAIMREADSSPVLISFSCIWGARVPKQTTGSVLGQDRDSDSSVTAGEAGSRWPDLKLQDREAFLTEIKCK